MTWNSRLDVAEALECAGWTGDDDRPLEILRHPSGAVWAVTNDAGDCGVDTPGGGVADFPGDVADTVVIAAALAASGQLAPAVTAVGDEEGHARPHTAGSVAPDGGFTPDDLLALASVLEIARPGTGIPLQLRRSYGHTDRWAICDREGRRWHRAHGWVCEPDGIRDEALRDDTRYTLAEAVPLARRVAADQLDPVDEYRYCGATLDRTEFPYTCYRRVAHDGECGPEADCRHESWDVTGEHRTDAGWVKDRRCTDCSESLPSITEPEPHWDLRPAADTDVKTCEAPEDGADVTVWAARLDADRLQPDAHSLTWTAGPQPIVRVHFAFHEGLDDEARDYLVQAVGEALGREMTAAATP
ncbi:hypothetical protein [Streptomyces smyrnaeus]|uniref:hypothetical protein n=1 Tax=Streptomyces smyrnaeus TaxID=1387713 RepID=UPI003682C0C5